MTDLVESTIDGLSYWRAAEMVAITTQPSPSVYLLPPYDEYTIAYKDYSAFLDPSFGPQSSDAIYRGAIVIDYQVVGCWRRSFSKGTVHIQFEPYRPFSAAEMDAIVFAAQAYGEFHGMPVEVTGALA